MKQENNAPVRIKHRSQTQEVWRRFRKSRSAVLGLSFILLIILISLLAGVIFDYDTQVISAVGERLQHPSFAHPFGTDELGRDIFIRVLYGARYSLAVGFVAACIPKKV